MDKLGDRLTADLKAAMRSKDEARLRTIRSIRAALMQKEIAERRGGVAQLSSEQELAVLRKEARQRHDAIEQFAAAGRDDLTSREREELAIIEEYLPEAATEDEIRAVVRRVIAESGASGLADLGKIMRPAIQALEGRADGSAVQRIVREELEA